MKLRVARWPAVAFVALLLLTLPGCRSSKNAVKGGKEKVEHVQEQGKLSKVQRRIVDEAMEWMGTPYLYGGAEKGSGTDCSGMVLSVYRDVAGIMLPRNSAQQAEFCRGIDKKEVRCGDLVFFATGRDPNRVSHVGIMMDSDRFIHASSSKGVVVSSVSTPYYIRTFMKYGRVL